MRTHDDYMLGHRELQGIRFLTGTRKWNGNLAMVLWHRFGDLQCGCEEKHRHAHRDQQALTE
jgi:hypothetical protein